MSPTTLLSLLSTSPYLLAYSLPLFFLSFVLNFSGTLLTLDRTRSFAPQYESLPTPGAFDSAKKSKFKFVLEGGVGGLFFGFVLGVHLSTFLVLVIPSLSSAKPLFPGSFLAAWLLSSLVTTFVCGRWKYAVLTLVGITGGTCFALALSVIVHPSLLTRQIFCAIAVPILTLFTILPIAKVQHGALRFAFASTGSFGIILAISLFARIPSWSNVWERYWISDGNDWHTGQERGLSAGYCLFLLFGGVCDFFLHRMVGECPDEKWDSYLAKYTSNLPNRAGTFQPFASVWDRLTGTGDSNTDNKNIVFPDDDLEDAKGDSKPHRHELPRYTSVDDLPLYPNHLKKGRSKRSNHARFQAKLANAAKDPYAQTKRKTREAVKFRPTDGDASSDSEDELIDSKKSRPWLRQMSSSTSSNATLVDESFSKAKLKALETEELNYEKEIKQLRGKVKGMGEGEIPEYSDYESDIATPKTPPRSPKTSSKEWSPGFLKRHSTSFNSTSTSSGRRTSDTSTVVESTKSASQSQQPLQPVPATPSLIKALDRLALAQKEAYGGKDGLPSLAEEGQGQKWDSFWKEVIEKTSDEKTDYRDKKNSS